MYFNDTARPLIERRAELKREREREMNNNTFHSFCLVFVCVCFVCVRLVCYNYTPEVKKNKIKSEKLDEFFQQLSASLCELKHEK